MRTIFPSLRRHRGARAKRTGGEGLSRQARQSHVAEGLDAAEQEKARRPCGERALAGCLASRGGAMRSSSAASLSRQTLYGLKREAANIEICSFAPHAESRHAFYC